MKVSNQGEFKRSFFKGWHDPVLHHFTIVGHGLFFGGKSKAEITTMHMACDLDHCALHRVLELVVKHRQSHLEHAFTLRAETRIGEIGTHELQLELQVIRGGAPGEREAAVANSKTNTDIFAGKNALKVVGRMFPETAGFEDCTGEAVESGGFIGLGELT